MQTKSADFSDYWGISAQLASKIIDICRLHGYFIASAESLTGGLVADAFVRVPGASDVFLGSAVTYAVPSKSHILGVDAQLLKSQGAVHPLVAQQMAAGCAHLYEESDPRFYHRVFGISTTGVAGPGPDGDKPVGLVYIAVSNPNNETTFRKLQLQGSRQEIREQTVIKLLELLSIQLRADSQIVC